MRSRPVWLLFMFVLASLAGPGSAAATSQADAKNTLRFPVYLNIPNTAEGIDFTVSTETEDLKSLSSSPIAPTRPILLIVDPTSYSLSDLQRRIASFIAGLHLALQSRPSLQIRVGLPLFDGILLDPPARPGSLPESAVNDILRFVRDVPAGQESDPSRILDLAASLLKKSETDGQSMDCLLLGKDRPFEGEDADYIRLSTEQRLLEICARSGSVLHAYLEGEGEIRSLCSATGGMVFDSTEQPELVVRRILDARDRGFLIAVPKPTVQAGLGRHALSFRVEDNRGNPISSHAPVAVWLSPEDTSAPDRESVREALNWLRRAQSSADAGDFRVALRFVENALQLDPCNPGTAYLGARCSLELGDLSSAAAFVSRAAQFAHPSERTLLLYGEILRKTGKSAQALDLIRSLPRGDVPRSLEFQLMTARLLASGGHEREAAEIYSGILVERQSDSQIRAEYGCVLWRLGNAAAAAVHIESALATDSENIAAMICSMDMALARGETGKALDLGARAARLQPHNPDVHAQIGFLHMQAQEWDPAVESYRTASELVPSRSDIMLKLAEAQLRSGQNSDAQETLGRVLALDSSNAVTFRIAGLYADAGSFENAAWILEGSAGRAPDQAPSLLRRAAELRERKGQYGQALLDYRALLESLPADQAAALRTELGSHLAFLSLMLQSPAHSPGDGGNAADKTPAPADSKPAAQSGIIAPGGLPLLAKMLGMAPESLKGPGGAGRALSVVLDSIPRVPAKELSPLQAELIENYREYENLLRYMRQRNLLPDGKSDLPRQEMVFPLVGDPSAIQRTKTLLGFFGVQYSSSRTGSQDSVDLRYKTDRTSTIRQRLLRRLGTDLQAKKLSEIRFTIGDETLSSILNPGVLRDKLLNLPASGAEDLFSRLVRSPDAMVLYRALEDCAPLFRETLVQVLSPRELVDLKSALIDYGRFLDFHQDRLALPGSQTSWERLVGTPYADARAFLRAFVTHGKGRLLLAYFALQAASPEAQSFITNATGGLEELAGLNPPAGTGLTAVHWKADLVRIMRMLSADEHGLFLPIRDGFGRYLLPDAVRAQASPQASGYRPLRVNLQDVAVLLQPKTRTQNSAVRTGAGIVEFLDYLQQVRPRMLTDASVDAIGRTLMNAPALIDVIWDLDPPADLLVRYLDSCAGFLNMENSNWKVNRTRTSQAIVFLISLLRRENAVDLRTGWSLLAAALESLTARDETEFLANTSGYLTDRLFPALRRPEGSPAVPADVLLQSLAGRNPPQHFLFDGTPIVQEEPSARLQRMQASIRPQRICPLPEILSAITPLLDPLNLEGDLQRLAEGVGKLTCAGQSDQPAENAQRRKSAPTLSSVAGQLESLLKKQGLKARSTPASSPPVTTQQLVQQITSLLDAELGVTLLAHCYAYYGAPQIAALSYNTDFVRSHDFLGSGRAPRTYWPGAELETDNDRRGIITGSLSGLGIQMQQLEMGPSAQSFGKEPWNRLVPAMLSGIRIASASLRSNRVQEYVALSVRLGRELLALHAGVPLDGGWLEQCIGLLLPPARRELLKSLLANGGFGEAAGVLSPSELLQLGEAYLLSSSTLPASTCSRLAGFMRRADSACAKELSGKVPPLKSPTLERLRDIIPAAGAPDLERFQLEVEQYGFSVWRRIGLSVSSFHFYEPYERLQFPATLDMLFERLNDLKVQLAEIGYSAGLPASLGGLLGDLALQRLITDPAAAGIQYWQDIIDEIGRLGPEQCRGWIEELLNTGALTIYSGKTTQHQEEY